MKNTKRMIFLTAIVITLSGCSVHSSYHHRGYHHGGHHHGIHHRSSVHVHGHGRSGRVLGSLIAGAVIAKVISDVAHSNHQKETIVEKPMKPHYLKTRDEKCYWVEPQGNGEEIRTKVDDYRCDPE